MLDLLVEVVVELDSICQEELVLAVKTRKKILMIIMMLPYCQQNW